VSTKTEDLLRRRERLLGPNVSTFYEDPIHVVKADGVWLWDADGRRYLDCYNNVPHVGNCNHAWLRRSANRQAC
jgi:4-aminobutyrate aminotransferase-like enzyme